MQPGHKSNNHTLPQESSEQRLSKNDPQEVMEIIQSQVSDAIIKQLMANGVNSEQPQVGDVSAVLSQEGGLFAQIAQISGATQEFQQFKQGAQQLQAQLEQLENQVKGQTNNPQPSQEPKSEKKGGMLGIIVGVVTGMATFFLAGIKGKKDKSEGAAPNTKAPFVKGTWSKVGIAAAIAAVVGLAASKIGNKKSTPIQQEQKTPAIDEKAIQQTLQEISVQEAQMVQGMVGIVIEKTFQKYISEEPKRQMAAEQKQSHQQNSHDGQNLQDQESVGHRQNGSQKHGENAKGHGFTEHSQKHDVPLPQEIHLKQQQQFPGHSEAHGFTEHPAESQDRTEPASKNAAHTSKIQPKPAVQSLGDSHSTAIKRDKELAGAGAGRAA